MRLLSKLFGWLNLIGKDRYMHVVLGAFIASVTLCLFCQFPMWADISISILIVLTAALVKDCLIDSKADILDIVSTLIGGIMVWLGYIVGAWM